MLDISNYCYLTIEKVHSDKKNKDYSACCLRFKDSDDKIILSFITNSLYDTLYKLIEDKK